MGLALASSVAVLEGRAFATFLGRAGSWII
jgi:hypothetical protein